VDTIITCLARRPALQSLKRHVDPVVASRHLNLQATQWTGSRWPAAIECVGKRLAESLARHGMKFQLVLPAAGSKISGAAVMKTTSPSV